MSNLTLGQKIGYLRKVRKLTQEELAEKLGVSPQAVSKWENDISCPDIMLLPEIAKLFNVTVDSLLGCEPEKTVQLVPQEQRRKLEDLILRIKVNSCDGDNVRINLPLALVKTGMGLGLGISQVSTDGALKDVDFKQILSMAENGLIGKLLEIESGEGDIVEIVVEEV
ncbi:MAG: helix-turn-helix domain-containing protein [Bacteroides sp.]|nr:helix-turn-helix domain-containing protein [Bacteroides sp.]